MQITEIDVFTTQILSKSFNFKYVFYKTPALLFAFKSIKRCVYKKNYISNFNTFV